VTRSTTRGVRGPPRYSPLRDSSWNDKSWLMQIAAHPRVSIAIPLLILFTERLVVRFAVRIKESLAALLPRRFEFGRCDVTVRPTFLSHGTQVRAEIFHSGPAEYEGSYAPRTWTRHNDDILGDAYEYLMRHFATESGKSKGQFYTPAEVSRVIAQILRIRYAKTGSDASFFMGAACGFRHASV
jgi:N-6 DNA Methylase